MARFGLGGTALIALALWLSGSSSTDIALGALGYAALLALVELDAIGGRLQNVQEQAARHATIIDRLTERDR
jgi:hypothetical protein